MCDENVFNLNRDRVIELDCEIKDTLINSLAISFGIKMKNFEQANGGY